MVHNRSVSIEDLSRLVIGHARNRDRSRRFILGIAGPPAAGKSTLAARLRDEINAQSDGHIAEVAPMDGFHLSNSVLTASRKLWRKGAPDTFAVTEFAALLVKARREGSKEIAWPTYNRTVHEPTPGGVRFSSTIEILITEGNYLLLDNNGWSAVGNSIDERWYLDIDVATVEQRLLERHMEGGKTRDEAQQKVSASDLPNALLVTTTKPRAHLILNEVGGTYYAMDVSSI